VVVDEYGVHLALSRAYARAPRGLRAEVNEPFNPGAKQSVISALRLSGLVATLVVEGAVDTAVFETFVEQALAPELGRGDIVLLDNVSFHHSARVRDLIEGAGARLEHLPTYSPDLSPIEECISKIKARLRQEAARTKLKLRRALARAEAAVSARDIRGWFTHCGYTCPLS
jgi:transposase